MIDPTDLVRGALSGDVDPRVLSDMVELERLVERIEDDPLLAYWPLPHQVRFHLSPAGVRANCSANQTGKTHSAGIEVRGYSRGDWPEWIRTGRDVPVRRPPRLVPSVISIEDFTDAKLNMDGVAYTERRYLPRRPTKGRIIVKRFTGPHEAVITKLHSMFPAGTYKTRRNSQGVENRWWVKSIYGGWSEFDILSDDAQEDSYEGWVGDWCMVDETVRHSTYTATMRGLMSLGGCIFLTLTPLMGSWWMNDLIVKPAKAGEKNYWFNVVDILENSTERGGTLTPAKIAEFERTIPPPLRPARLHGQFVALTGIVFGDDFRRDIHVVERSKFSQEWWSTANIWVVIDPHPRRAPFIIFVAVGSDERMCVFDEYPNRWPNGEIYWAHDGVGDPHSVEKTAKVIRDILARAGREPDEVIIDPRGGSHVYDGESFRDKLAEAGIDAVPAPIAKRTEMTEIEDSLEKVRAWLLWDSSQPMTGDNCPRLYVLRSCHNTAWGLENWRYKEIESTEDNLPHELKFAEQGKDPCDCLRYLAFADPSWVPAVPVDDVDYGERERGVAGY